MAAESVDAIVIGGGLHGCSMALQLARRGLAPLLIERDYVGRHASGVNAGGVRRLLRDPAEVPLSVAAMKMWSDLPSLLGEELAPLCQFRGGGQLAVAENGADMHRLEARAAEMAAAGWSHEELVDRTELRGLLPHVAPHCVGGLISRADGHAHPYRTTQAFRLRAAALGARVIEGVAVRGLERSAGRWRIATTAGTFVTDTVINCAGAWGSDIAKAVGEKLPDDYFAPMMMVTARMPALLTPVVIGVGRKLSFKQTEVGSLLIGGGLSGSGHRDSGQTTLAVDRLAVSARTVSELFPTVRAARIVRGWAGLEALMPDAIPVIGRSGVAPGVWHAFGFSGHGFQLAPVVGAIVAELITTGRSPLPIDAFRPERFARGALRPHPSAI